MTKYEVQTQHDLVETPSREDGQVANSRWNWRSYWSNRNEKPKVAISNSRFRAFRRCLVVLSPIPLTLIVLGLNLSNYYCFDWGRPNQNSIIDALQFVAKIHDVLITASVSAIVLHRVLFDLAMKDGASLTTLTPAYQLTQSRFLFKWAFWTDIFGRGRISLGILIGLAVFLVNIANPAAAIAIIPKSGWWPVPQSMLWSGLGYTSVKAFYITNSTSVWPDEVSASYLPSDCLSSWAVLEASCPAAGYLPVTEALLNDGFQSNGWWNVLLSNDDISRSLTALGPDYFTNPNFRNRWAIASSVSQIMASSLWSYDNNMAYNLTLGFEGPVLLKPLVQVECAVSDVVNSALVFPHSYIPVPGINSNESWTVDTTIAWDDAISEGSSDVHFIWSSLPNNNSGPSLLAAFNLNNTGNSFNYTDASGVSHTGDNNTAFTCSVDARWAPVQMWMLPGNDLDFRIHEITPFDLDNGPYNFLWSPDQIPNLQQIQIDPAWAASLNVYTSNSTTTLTMEQIVRISEYMNSDAWSYGTSDAFLNLVAAGLGMMVTDGLARLSWSDQLVALVTDNSSSSPYLANFGNNASLDATILDASQIDPDWLEMDFASSRLGWSYGLTGATIKFALAVLVLHLIIAVFHTGIVVASRDVWTTASWRSIGELLVLAINSDCSEKLQNTCAGIDLSSTWQKKLKIRETTEGHLGLVVDDDALDDVEPGIRLVRGKPVPGRLYGRIRTNDKLQYKELDE